MNTILFYDAETTGFPDWKSPSGSEHQPHLVQLAAILANADTREIISTVDLIIQPNGWEIPVEVSEIHGITTEIANKVGVNEADALAVFMQMTGGKRVAHNKTFDQRIIRIGLKRYGYTDEAIDQWGDKENHDCTMRMAHPIMQLGKNPKLSEAYLHFTGKELQNAHTAMADAQACMEIYWAIEDQAKASAA
ncbi:3'-5' exonuclease [Neptunomonas marina]|uniref:3'-5' exonuclease n=1 Tax=Neptunomonas marina TaxID=1815562 RepID=A0A437QDQ3_9GAMM|nr:3'-5' exonuclease [Neptunomonas marina]RVU32680.1 3'-5' exonuclease [Neptunomonas marina]